MERKRWNFSRPLGRKAQGCVQLLTKISTLNYLPCTNHRNWIWIPKPGQAVGSILEAWPPRAKQDNTIFENGQKSWIDISLNEIYKGQQAPGGKKKKDHHHSLGEKWNGHTSYSEVPPDPCLNAIINKSINNKSWGGWHEEGPLQQLIWYHCSRLQDWSKSRKRNHWSKQQSNTWAYIQNKNVIFWKLKSPLYSFQHSSE